MPTPKLALIPFKTIHEKIIEFPNRRQVARSLGVADPVTLDIYLGRILYKKLPLTLKRLRSEISVEELRRLLEDKYDAPVDAKQILLETYPFSTIHQRIINSDSLRMAAIRLGVTSTTLAHYLENIYKSLTYEGLKRMLPDDARTLLNRLNENFYDKPRLFGASQIVLEAIAGMPQDKEDRTGGIRETHEKRGTVAEASSSVASADYDDELFAACAEVAFDRVEAVSASTGAGISAKSDFWRKSFHVGAPPSPHPLLPPPTTAGTKRSRYPITAGTDTASTPTVKGHYKTLPKRPRTTTLFPLGSSSIANGGAGDGPSLAVDDVFSDTKTAEPN